MSSRSFTSKHALPERLPFAILFPVVDIANHSIPSHVSWEFSASPKAFRLLLDRGVHTGEEILNNYGPKGNDELLMGYGFCLPNNPVEQYSFKLPEGFDFTEGNIDPKGG
jgi:hypothetical protein